MRTSRHRDLATLFVTLSCAGDEPDAMRRVVEAVAADTGSRQQVQLEELAALLRQGLPLADAFALLPECISPETARFIGESSATGRLEGALAMLAEDFAWLTQRERETWASMSYPLLLLLGAVIISWFMTIIVIPAFQDVFRSMGGELPLATLGVLAMVSWVGSALPILGLALLLIPLLRAPLLARLRNALVARLGLIRAVRRYRSHGIEPRLLLALSHSLDGALPIRSMFAHLAANADGHEARLLKQIEQRLGQGDSLAVALQSVKELPKRLGALAGAAGAGKQVSSLRRLAALAAEGALDQRAIARRRLSAVLYVAAAVFIAFCAIGLYLPIFKMGSVT